jgi:protein TonB
LSLAVHSAIAAALWVTPLGAVETSRADVEIDAGRHSVRVSVISAERFAAVMVGRAAEATVEAPVAGLAPPGVTRATPSVEPEEVRVAVDAPNRSVAHVEESERTVSVGIDAREAVETRVERVERGEKASPASRVGEEAIGRDLMRVELALPEEEASGERQESAEGEVWVVEERGGGAASAADDAGASAEASVAGGLSPSYPALSRRLGESGLVVLEVRVLADGRAGEVRVVERPGHERLVRAALEAAREARYTPARSGGERIDSWLRVPVRFVLE